MTYDYKCLQCGFEFEVEHPMNEKPIITCEACGQMICNRLISSNTTFILKGSGWFKDGYESKKAVS